MVLFVYFSTGKSAPFNYGGGSGSAGSQEGIEDESIRRRQSPYESLNETDRKLARMLRLLDTACLDLRNIPDVTGVFPEGIAAVLALLSTFVVLFPGITLGQSDGIQVEMVVIPFGVPKDNLMAPAKTLRTVKAAIEAPNDPVTEYDIGNRRKYLVNNEVQRCKSTILDVVAHLPADVSTQSRNLYYAWNDSFVFFAEVVHLSTFLIAFANAVRR